VDVEVRPDAALDALGVQPLVVVVRVRVGYEGLGLHLVTTMAKVDLDLHDGAICSVVYAGGRPPPCRRWLVGNSSWSAAQP